MTAHHTYDMVADFIASMNPKKVLELKAPRAMQSRLEMLIQREKESNLSFEEKDELDHYIVLERLIRLSKVRALYRLKQG
ncbi:MAG: hypothetical protein AAGG68_21515 [Bacteroidota bacterium]